VAALLATGAVETATVRSAAPSVTVFASGLNDPRGLAFGPNGHLYVAEAGSGGASTSTVGLCDQVAAIGPITGGFTGRVLEIAPNGGVAEVVSGLPSSEAIPQVGGDKLGVSSVAFIGNQLHALIAGGGCSHGHVEPGSNNAVVTIDRYGVSQIADLSTWLLANPGAKGAEEPRNPDYEPDGTWYSLLFANGRLYATEPNHGLLVSVHHERGDVALESDLFSQFGDHTYTALAADRGDLYVGTLGQIVWNPAPPIPDVNESFAAGIYRLSRNGHATQFASGLRAVLGLAFDQQHQLYALESPIFVPGTGRLVRVSETGNHQTVLGGLTFPSAVIRGPDNAFYISECGYHCQPGEGRILRVTF
jgi:hypothetical protein